MEIQRDLMHKLVEWKAEKNRKPLILQGVRQCGKTWLLQEFGKKHFKDIAYFNFETQETLSSFFEKSLEPKQIIFQLGAFLGKKIIPNETLVIFDEIQASPNAINSLKYFCEQAPEYAIVSAGSLLGISLASNVGFPVGKVSFLELTPCSFKEYLRASDEMMCEYISTIEKIGPLPEAMCLKLAGYFKEYIALGGMPEVLKKFIETKDLFESDKILSDIIKSYELDFSKHAPKVDIPKLFLLWKSIPEQLADENSKFVYGEVRNGARAKDLEDALTWLKNAGLVIQVNNVKNSAMPLTAYEERKAFKLYMADVGVLRNLAKIPMSIATLNVDIFGEFKGRLAENYVLQQLNSMNINPICYWTGVKSEVDFVIQNEMDILPIEVKSGLNVYSKSLKFYRQTYNPKLSLRVSMANLKLDDGLLNIPLYLISELNRFLK